MQQAATTLEEIITRADNQTIELRTCALRELAYLRDIERNPWRHLWRIRRLCALLRVENLKLWLIIKRRDIKAALWQHTPLWLVTFWLKLQLFLYAVANPRGGK